MNGRFSGRIERGFLLVSAFCLLTCGTEADYTSTLVQGEVGLTRGATVRLAWDANQEPDLAGYWLYQSNVSGRYSRLNRILKIPAGVETCSVGPLHSGRYFWVVTAFNRNLYESGHSNEVSAVVD